MSEHFMDINEIQKVLINFPEIVFCNLPLAKMHDSLPINLFSLHNFLIAFDKKKSSTLQDIFSQLHYL